MMAWRKNFVVGLLVMSLVSSAWGEALRLVFVGDVMLDDGPGRTVAAGGDPLAPFAAELRNADFTIGNLECPIATGGKVLENKLFAFRAHPRVIDVLRGRFDALSLANNHSGDYGKDAFVEGLALTGNMGALDISAIFAKENSLWTPNNRLFAIRGGVNLSKNAGMGVTLAQYQYYEGDTTQHWAIDGSVKSGKHKLTAEYTQSNKSSENMAYALIWSYGFNDRTTFYLTNFRVEANGDMGAQSEYNNNNRGFHYGITHSFSDALSLEIIYKDQYGLTDNAKNTKFETTLRHTF